jgi:hypothetical protein
MMVLSSLKELYWSVVDVFEDDPEDELAQEIIAYWNE